MHSISLKKELQKVGKTMLYTIVNESDVFYDWSLGHTSQYRSSNPYDYLRFGYFIDNAQLFGGKNNVVFKSDFTGNRSSNL